MLQRLRIENLAVVEDVTLVLGPGLNVLTGSTGAGKSLVVGAVNLLLGERVGADAIRSGCDEARVEAVFDAVDVSRHPALSAHVGAGEPVVLTRRVNRSGRSHAALGTRAIPLKALREVAAALIEPHGQNEPYRLRDPDRHVEYVDACAGNATARGAYADALSAWRRSRTALDRFDAELAAMREKRELYAHRIQEIDAVAPRTGEKASLESAARMMASAEKVYGVLDAVCHALYDDDDAAASRLGESEHSLASIEAIDPRLAEIRSQLAECREALAEATARARAILEGLDFEPADVERVQERLESLARLERRYKTSIESLLEQRGEWAAAIDAVDDGDARRGALVADFDAASARLRSAGAELTKSRRRAARDLDRRMTDALQHLFMRGSSFRTDIQLSAGNALTIEGAGVEPLENGLDVVRLKIRTNPGESEGDLSAIASTGELSRVALVLKELTAAGTPGATLIFDEIDAGVGADLGDVLAEKLLALARNHQIICITHMPQIAARGQLHLVVTKEIEGERTRVRIRPAEGEDRTREIARMLGGEAGSERRLALADEMLDRRGKHVRP